MKKFTFDIVLNLLWFVLSAAYFIIAIHAIPDGTPSYIRYALFGVFYMLLFNSSKKA
jgi:hypothetical protein